MATVSTPASPQSKEIAVLWTRDDVRCVLATDGSEWLLSLFDRGRPLRTMRLANVEGAMKVGAAWLGEHGGEG